MHQPEFKPMGHQNLEEKHPSVSLLSWMFKTASVEVLQPSSWILSPLWHQGSSCAPLPCSRFPLFSFRGTHLSFESWCWLIGQSQISLAWTPQSFCSTNIFVQRVPYSWKGDCTGNSRFFWTSLSSIWKVYLSICLLLTLLMMTPKLFPRVTWIPWASTVSTAAHQETLQLPQISA